MKENNSVYEYGKINFINEDVPGDLFLSHVYSPIDLISYWKRCGIVSDFYTQFCSESIEKVKDEYVSNYLSTIFNELIENAAKFSVWKDTDVIIELKSYFRLIKFTITNCIDQRGFDVFSDKLNRFFYRLGNNETIEDIYFNYLEGKDANDNTSGLGYFMMMKDYPVDFGFRLKKIQEDRYEVRVESYISCNTKK